MDTKKIHEIFNNIYYTVMFTRFVEDGYEITLKAEDESVSSSLDTIQIDGFAIVDFAKRVPKYRILIVPKTMQEMVDYVWRYVGKFGNKDEKFIDVLGDAVCALEKAIDRIPNTEEKNEAKHNFEKFTSQIF